MAWCAGTLVTSNAVGDRVAIETEEEIETKTKATITIVAVVMVNWMSLPLDLTRTGVWRMGFERCF